MNISPLYGTLLGLLQGLTEFLPVSSSGHLVIAQNLLGIKEPNLLFDIWLHLATLIAVCFYYRHDILDILKDLWPHAKDVFAKKQGALTEDRPAMLGWMVVLASIPTGLMGFLLKDTFENLFSSIKAVAGALLITAGLLTITHFVKTRDCQLVWWKALLIGIIQGLAITPGISRSGSTIALALILGISTVKSARFSFLLSIPAICGALLLQLLHLESGVLSEFAANWPGVLLGFFSAMVSGLAALILLVKMVKAQKFYLFAPYLVIISALVFFLM